MKILFLLAVIATLAEISFFSALVISIHDEDK